MVADPAATIDELPAHFAGAPQHRLDGLTVDLGDCWFNLRPSHTAPPLRLNLEAPTPEACAARTAELVALIRKDL